jgi:iron complex transport system ATP-binding protein
MVVRKLEVAMLTIQSLYVRYGQRIVLDGVSLQVNCGEVLAVIGPNGAGKSTLIRTISGVLQPCGGSIAIDGQDLARLSPGQRARRLAVVPQASQLPDSYTVYQTVLLGRTAYMNLFGQAAPRDHEQVLLALEKTNTMDLAERLVGELSGGERQRVLLARALAQGAPYLLLDEPTTFLDLQHQSGLLNLIRRLSKDKNLGVLMVLHDLNLASLYADRVAILTGGKITAQGSPAQVLTEDRLTSIYRVPVHVIPHPDYGTPLILPDGRDERMVSRRKP